MIKLYNKFYSQLLIIFIILFSSFLLYLPFLLRAGDWFGLKIFDSNMQYVYRNYDGPLYIIAAKSFYDPAAIQRTGLELPLPAEYFAAHLPMYPFFIRLLGPSLGYLKAMLSVNLLFSVFLGLFFYYLVKQLKLTKKPLLLTIVFMFLPRLYVVRSVGAPESLFILLILLSLFFFEREKFLWAGIFGGLSVMTKTPGVLLFAAYLLVFVERYIRTRKIEWKGYLSICLVPLGLITVFLIYLRQYGNFFAYFHSGDNFHLVTPFAVFNSLARWVRSAWLEDIVFYFFIYALSLFYLRESKYRSFYYFGAVFFIATLFIQHRDIARYSLPLWPMACIAFEKFFTSRKFLYAFVVILPGIYLYALNFILSNVMPVANWKPFL